MKKLTTLFLTLALLAGISAVFGANAADAVKKLPKPDSYEALKLDPKHGIGDNLVELTKRDRHTLFTDEMKVKLKTQASYLNEYEDDLFQWFRLADGRIALVYKDIVKDVKGNEVKAKPATIYSVSMQANQKITPGREIMVLSIPGRSKAKVKNMGNFLPLVLNPDLRPRGNSEPRCDCGLFRAGNAGP